ncbi:MAG: alpha/beta hydrolase [Gemmatimonadota bacterium]|nr:alpha/beta hydrolase [Gemmatimonadota bacterium]
MNGVAAKAACLGLLISLGCSEPPERDPLQDTSLHESRFVQADGIALHVLDWGGSGESLLLVHGSGWSPHYFDDLAPFLADRFRLIAPARRGHGQSGIPGEPFDVDVLAEDLRVILDSLGIERTNLLGASFAGAEITRFAALYPERVERLIYLEAHYERVGSPWDTLRLSRPQLPCFGGGIDSLPQMRRCLQDYLRPGLEWSPTMEAVLLDIIRRDDDGGYHLKTDHPTVSPSFSLVNASYRREYELLEMPVLAIFAERFYPVTGVDAEYDRQVVAWHERCQLEVSGWAMRRFRDAIPQVKIVSLPGSAHEELVYNDPEHRDPERLAEEVLAFLRGSRAP